MLDLEWPYAALYCFYHWRGLSFKPVAFFSLVSVVWPHFETRQDSSELEFGIKQGGDQENFDKMREAFEYLDDRQSREQSSDRLNLKSACCGIFAEGSKIVEVG